MKGRTYRYFEGEVLYGFGYGLSYTEFRYSELKVRNEMSTRDDISIEIEVENTGNYDGDEIVQLYLKHSNSDIPVPIHALKGFRRIQLKKGEKRTIKFTLRSKQLAVINDRNERIVMPGIIELFVGGQQPNDKLLISGKILSAKIVISGEPNVINNLTP